jgi:hypothetical protein
MPFFCCATIFLFSPRCFSFVAPRYFCFHRAALLLLRHDIFDFTTMPSFVASRYFCICTNFVRSQTANTGLSGAPRSFAKPARSMSRPLQHGVSKDGLPFTRTFSPNPNTTFISFTTLLFVLSRFVFHPTFNFCRDAFGF